MVIIRYVVDTDGDGISDADEDNAGSNKNDANSRPGFSEDTSHLVAWYKLDGDLTNEMSEHAIIPAANGTFEADAAINQSIKLPNGDAMTLPSEAVAPLFSGVLSGNTLSFWFKASSDTPMLLGAYKAGYDRYLVQNYNNTKLYWTRQDDRSSGSNYKGVDVNFVYGATMWDAWHHMALVSEWNGSNIVSTLYLDGVAQSLTVNSGGAAWSNPPDYLEGEGLIFGGINQPGYDAKSGTKYFDDIRVYNKALSADEVAQLYVPDTDGDGASDAKEAIDGTDPRDYTSFSTTPTISSNSGASVSAAEVTDMGDGSTLMVFKYDANSDNGQGQTEYTVDFPANVMADVLIVAGGGGGGRRTAGGGGAGTLIYDQGVNMNGSHTVRVGRGGAGSATAGNIGGAISYESKLGEQGKSSEIIWSDANVYYKAIGGGGGVGGSVGQNGQNGGSGGGGSSRTSSYGGVLSTENIYRGNVVMPINNTAAHNFSNEPSYNSPFVFGNEAGRASGYHSPYLGSGGGGAGGRGVDSYGTSHDANNASGVGGPGKAINITGESKYYAAGGGGGNWSGNTYYNDGGSGIGGRSGTVSEAPTDGMAHTGSGGGGDGPDVYNGGNGGSGIVIIRYHLIPMAMVLRIKKKRMRGLTRMTRVVH